MPRLPHSLLLRAYRISPFLPLVLRGTRTLDSAIDEFRWLREHVEASKPPSLRSLRKRLLHLCKRRSRAEPLQYILGSQPFGPLDIKCRPGVLIPRPETEAYTSHLAELLISGKLDKYLSIPAPKIRQGRIITPRKQLSILDVCSGSGCISLLLHSLLSKSGKFPNLRTLGLDISPQAVALANENLALNTQQGHFPISNIRNEADAGRRAEELRNAFVSSRYRLKRNKARYANFAFFPRDKAIHFARHDIFTSLPRPLGNFSIIISNPPYISCSSFGRDTARSVRLYEPKLALVPDPEKYSLSKKKNTQSTALESGTNISIQASKPETPLPKKKKPPLEVDSADIFYSQLLRIYVWRSAKILLMEVGDTKQALRVLKLALSKNHIAKTNKFEIWRDFPGQAPREGGRYIHQHKRSVDSCERGREYPLRRLMPHPFCFERRGVQGTKWS